MVSVAPTKLGALTFRGSRASTQFVDRAPCTTSPRRCEGLLDAKLLCDLALHRLLGRGIRVVPPLL
jgi:hypothetical protein